MFFERLRKGKGKGLVKDAIAVLLMVKFAEIDWWIEGEEEKERERVVGFVAFVWAVRACMD